METCKNCGKPIHKISLLNNGELWLHEGEINVCRRTYAEPLVSDKKEHIYTFTKYSVGKNHALRMTCNCGVVLTSAPGTTLNETLFREEFDLFHERFKDDGN